MGVRLEFAGESGWTYAREGDGDVKLAKRLAVALGSLLALAFAGGAHIRW